MARSTNSARASPRPKVRARVEEMAERGDGLWLTPPTYFIPSEQLLDYQQKIVETFGPTVLPKNLGRSKAGTCVILSRL